MFTDETERTIFRQQGPTKLSAELPKDVQDIIATSIRDGGYDAVEGIKVGHGGFTLYLADHTFYRFRLVEVATWPDGMIVG